MVNPSKEELSTSNTTGYARPMKKLDRVLRRVRRSFSLLLPVPTAFYVLAWAHFHDPWGQVLLLAGIVTSALGCALALGYTLIKMLTYKAPPVMYEQKRS
jgi:hypothetical protein